MIIQGVTYLFGLGIWGCGGACDRIYFLGFGGLAQAEVLPPSEFPFGFC